MKTKYIKISFNDDVSQDIVDLIAEAITSLCDLADVTAIQVVSEEDCEAKDEQAS